MKKQAHARRWRRRPDQIIRVERGSRLRSLESSSHARAPSHFPAIKNPQPSRKSRSKTLAATLPLTPTAATAAANPQPCSAPPPRPPPPRRGRPTPTTGASRRWARRSRLAAAAPPSAAVARFLLHPRARPPRRCTRGEGTPPRGGRRRR